MELFSISRDLDSELMLSDKAAVYCCMVELTVRDSTEASSVEASIFAFFLAADSLSDLPMPQARISPSPLRYSLPGMMKVDTGDASRLREAPQLTSASASAPIIANLIICFIFRVLI